MYFSNILTSLVALAVLDIAAAVPQGQNGNNGNNNNGQNNNGNNNNNGNDCNNANAANNANTGNTGNNNAAALTLDSSVVQSASDTNGNPTDGEAASLTDPANFINFCSGKTITNGLQNTAGSCNGVVMGDMPSQDNMISSIIINPAPGDNIDADTTFQVQFQTSNLVAGTFTNPDNTYYAAPQQLQGGKVVGHSHVTIQNLGNSLTPDSPPDPTQFAFFLGIDNAGNGDGLLSATVTGGLPAGNYRVCTLTSASNHQPVLMPVAKRGAQDDCTKFTVGGSGNSNANGNANNNGGNQQQGNNNQGNNNQNGAANTQSSAAASQTGAANTQSGSSNTQNGSNNQNGAASQDCNNQQSTNTQANGNAQSTGAAQTQNGNQNQQQQRGGSGRGRGNGQRFAAREFIS